MTYQEILAQARTCSGPYCKACPVCNGLACKNTVPGPGAKGIGTGAIRNYQKWQEVLVNLDTICENKPADPSVTLLGRRFAAPFFAAPIGALKLHYGDKHDDLSYNNILVPACAEEGIAAFTGDGTDPRVFEGACAAIRRSGGAGPHLHIVAVGGKQHPSHVRAVISPQPFFGNGGIIGNLPLQRFLHVLRFHRNGEVHDPLYGQGRPLRLRALRFRRIAAADFLFQKSLTIQLL